MYKHNEKIRFWDRRYMMCDYKEKEFNSEIDKQILESFGILFKENYSDCFEWNKSTDFFETSIKNIEDYRGEFDFDYKKLLKQYKVSLNNLIENEIKIEKLKKLIPYIEDDKLEKISQKEIKEKFLKIEKRSSYSPDVYLLSFNVFSVDFYREDTGFMRNQLVLGEKSLTFKTGKHSYDLFKEFKKYL